MSNKHRSKVRARPESKPPKSRGGLWLIPLVAGIVALVGFRAWPRSAGADTIPVAARDTTSAPAEAPSAVPAPPIQVTTIDGRQITDEQLRGKVVLLNFWATWCPPCRMEMPGFESVYERHPGGDFVVIGVAMDQGGTADVTRFLAEHHITYPVAMANGPVVRNFGGASLLPSSFVIDRKGNLRNQVQGAYAAEDLEQLVEQLLREPGPTRVGMAQ